MSARDIGLAAQFALAVLVLARLSKGRHRRPPLAAQPQAAGPVSVIIPARNEAARIGPCLDALAADPTVSEVVVVDDRSEDATAKIARDAGARVIEGEPLPEGWVGKQWALRQGLDAPEHDTVVLLDADTRPAPGLVGAAVAELENADVVSVAPRFRCRGAALQALHASMLCSLTYRFGPLGAAERPRPSRVIGNGQCLGARRDALLRSGALERTRAHMTDDIALLRALSADGWRVAFVDGADLLEVEMYATAAEAWREWPRTLAMADVTSVGWKGLDLATLAAVLALPVIRLAVGRAGRLDRALLAVRAALLLAFARFYSPRGPGFWLSPLADPLAIARLAYATARPVRAWRGRSYAAGP